MKLNKIIFIMLFAVLLILLMSTDIFAYSFVDNTGNSNNTYVVPDLPTDTYGDNYIIRYINGEGENRYDVFFLKEDYTFFLSSDEISMYVGGAIADAFSYYANIDNSWVSAEYSELSLNDCIYYHADIFYSEGELFFQKPPTQAIVATAVEGTEMEKVLQEILAILPVVIMILVGYLAFRKGLALLSALLQGA